MYSKTMINNELLLKSHVTIFLYQVNYIYIYNVKDFILMYFLKLGIIYRYL